MSEEGRGVLLVLAGTSGAGKGTIGERLRAHDPDLVWSVSWTTRARRAGEVDGRDYRFVSREEFQRARSEGAFVESFEHFGNLYGTHGVELRAALEAGRDVLAEVDVYGALEIRRRIPEAVLVFVRAPSRAEQRRRLLARATESPESVEARLARADEEEQLASRFDEVVVNDDPDEAAARLAAILQQRRNRSST